MIRKVDPRDARVLDALEWVTEVYDKMLELCDHYRIERPQGRDSSGWFMLALRLAMERDPKLYPFKKQVGRRVDPRVIVDDAIIFHWLATAPERGVSVAAAATHLSKRKRFRGRSAGAIRERYYRLCRPGPNRDRLIKFMGRLG